jgi:hypothetical protein
LLASQNYLTETCRLPRLPRGRNNRRFLGERPYVQACSNNRLQVRRRKVPDRDCTYESSEKLRTKSVGANFAKQLLVVTNILYCRYVLPD